MIVFPERKPISIASGAVSIGIGLIALVWPTMTAQVLALMVGAFLLIEALFSFLTRDRRALFTWSAVAQGFVGLSIALFLLLMPGTALRLVVLMIALWIVVRAGIQLWTAWTLRSFTGVPLFVGLTGALSLLVGVLLLTRPEAGIIAFSWLIAVYLIGSGVLVLMWGTR